MSLIGKIKSRLLFHGGEPYSLEEIESMDEEELGRLFKNHYEGPYANRNMVRKVTKIEAISIFVVSILAGILSGIGCFKSITTTFGQIILFLLIFILPIIGVCYATKHYNNLLMKDDWCVKWFFKIRDILKKRYLFNNDIDISWCVNKVQSGPASKLGVLQGLLKDVEDDRIHGKYTDEELGRLVKIISPLVEFKSSGGKFNWDTYSIIDERLGVNSALREFQDSTETRRKNTKRMEEQKKRRSEVDKAKEFADRTSTVLSESASRKTALDGSVEYNRIKDAANHVMETSDHLKGMITNEA